MHRVQISEEEFVTGYQFPQTQVAAAPAEQANPDGSTPDERAKTTSLKSEGKSEKGKSEKNTKKEKKSKKSKKEKTDKAANVTQPAALVQRQQAVKMQHKSSKPARKKHRLIDSDSEEEEFQMHRLHMGESEMVRAACARMGEGKSEKSEKAKKSKKDKKSKKEKMDKGVGSPEKVEQQLTLTDHWTPMDSKLDEVTTGIQQIEMMSAAECYAANVAQPASHVQRQQTAKVLKERRMKHRVIDHISSSEEEEFQMRRMLMGVLEKSVKKSKKEKKSKKDKKSKKSKHRLVLISTEDAAKHVDFSDLVSAGCVIADTAKRSISLEQFRQC